MIQNVSIDEYGLSEPLDLSDEDIHFIRRKVNDDSKSTKLEIRALGDSKYQLRAASFVGVTQLPSGRRLQINPKISELKLFHMIRYALDVKSKIYDVLPEYKVGRNYLDIIALLFKRELETIINRGLYKTYIHREENIKYLRGRLLIKEQVRNNTFRQDRLFCSYDDLSYDNLENQLVLCALHILTQIAHDREISLQLLALSDIMRSEVTLRPIRHYELDQINLTRLNEYYTRIIDLSKTIVQNLYIEDLTAGKLTAFSFLIDMNELFEKFILRILKKDTFSKYYVEGQRSTKNLVSPSTVSVKPDVVIRSRDKTREIKVVLDTKYKRATSNSDFYQVLAYCIAHNVDGVLVYPKHNNIKEEDFEVTKEGIDEQIHIRDVDLGGEESFAGYIERIRDELREKISQVVV